MITTKCMMNTLKFEIFGEDGGGNLIFYSDGSLEVVRQLFTAL